MFCKRQKHGLEHNAPHLEGKTSELLCLKVVNRFFFSSVCFALFKFVTVVSEHITMTCSKLPSKEFFNVLESTCSVKMLV